MQLQKLFHIFIIVFISFEIWAQAPSDIPAVVAKEEIADTGTAKPSGKRIRRQLNLIVGVEHDEEFLIPDIELTIGGRTEYFDINRIKGTDYFRILPKKTGSGITTLKDKKTGQIIVEIRFDIRGDEIEKTLREVQAMLADIEGIEFKIYGGMVYIDGYVLIPHDLIRIAQVIEPLKDRVKSLATLSPIARKKIADFITNDINNPEVKITAVGDFLKLEGQVNSQAEKDRIKQIVSLYIPDIVTEVAPSQDHIKIFGRKTGSIDSLIIDLITIKKDEEKVDPPPKMIQIVAHFVKFGDNYDKSFSFKFNPAVSSTSANGTPANSTIDSTIALLNNLLPKLNWAKTHGYAKILDTASVLVQDKISGSINRTITTAGTPLPPAGPGLLPTPRDVNATVSLKVTPIIKSERSGLIELKNLEVRVSTSGSKVEASANTEVVTTISVRDRQSAAFGGVIKKSTESNFGTPATSSTDPREPIINLTAEKDFKRINSQFVVFVTPIIKSSASSGVEQVKKKFRLRD